MATAMLTRVKNRLYGGIRDKFLFDATLSEQHEFKSRVTQFPIEDGSIITDHIINEPKRVTVTGFVTNAPVKVVDQQIPEGSDRVRDALQRLHTMYVNRELVTLVTGLVVYRDMAIESLSIPREPGQGDALHFSMTLVRITKVSSKTVPTSSLSNRASGGGTAAAGTTDQGTERVSTGTKSTRDVNQNTAALELFNNVAGTSIGR